MESGVRVRLLALVVCLSVSFLPLTQGAGKFLKAAWNSHTPFSGVGVAGAWGVLRSRAKVRWQNIPPLCFTVSGTCAELLLVPSFGRLLLERSDFTQSQNAVNVSEGDAVTVECAEGYQLTDSGTNTTLSVSQFVTTCQRSGEWSVDISNLACVQQTGKRSSQHCTLHNSCLLWAYFHFSHT